MTKRKIYALFMIEDRFGWFRFHLYIWDHGVVLNAHRTTPKIVMKISNVLPTFSVKLRHDE